MNFSKTFCLFAITITIFAGCSKKQQPQEQQNIQTEQTTEQIQQNELTKEENQNSFTEQEIQIIENIKRKIGTGKEGLTPVEPSGVYKIRYENEGRNKMVLAPIATISETDLKENAAAYEKYSSLLKAKTQPRADCYSTNDVTAIACQEKDDENAITIFFSNNQGERWTISKIDIDPKFIRDGRHLQFKIFCPNASTGYLIMYCTADEYSVKSGHIFKTQNAGVSWEQIGELPDAPIKDLFVQESTVFLNTKKEKFFCIFKSDDCQNWIEIDFPIDTENYDNGNISSFYFENNYGVVKFSLFNPSIERHIFATKDGGNTWTLLE